ncbi:MAG: serine/threonine-protein kinase [Thermoanaerobaculia bacterium]
MKRLTAGSRLGRFEITSVLGEGAMGIVYLAQDPHIERQVAVKTIRAEGGLGLERPEAESRFLKEAKLAGRLQHPNIVTIYEVGKDEDVFFIAMEYVEGEPLNRYLGGRGAFSLGERVEIIRQVARALEHAHARGVVHRDIKPGNILIGRDGGVKVADFGIGKLLTAGATEMTRTGQLIGSPAYMSPEQIRGEKLDGRSDLFSLGVVFFELLTGSRPFPGDSITTLVYQILHTEPRDPLELRGDLPPAAREVFARLLAKSPEKRPADAREFITEIRRIESRIRQTEQTHRLVVAPVLAGALSGRDPDPPPPGKTPVAAPRPAPEAPRETRPAAGEAPGAPPEAKPREERRGPAPAALFGLAAVLLAVAVLVWLARSTGERSPAGTPAPVLTPPPAVAGLPGAVPAPPTADAAAPQETPPAALESLPTAGPAAAADAVVGAPRYARATPSRSVDARRQSVERPPAVEPTSVPAVAAAPAPPPVEPPAAARVVDNVYRTRRFARFAVSPDQARLYVNGRYVGTADDWDDSGGGRDFEFSREGVHRVRLELPGYRDLNLEVLVTPAAEDDTVEVEDDLQRTSRVAFPELPSVSERTVGPVYFEVDPPDAMVSEGGRNLGPASSFGESNPLRLTGPAVHEFVLSAPGRRSKVVRVLVAPNAGEDVARVKEKLKEE